MSIFSVAKMTQVEAEEIAFQWHYPAPYSFYDLEADSEDLTEFIHPQLRGEHTYSIYKNGVLFAYFDVKKWTKLLSK
jgi:ribosomal-protein-alanine N-acetyltransferase